MVGTHSTVEKRAKRMLDTTVETNNVLVNFLKLISTVSVKLTSGTENCCLIAYFALNQKFISRSCLYFGLSSVPMKC